MALCWADGFLMLETRAVATVVESDDGIERDATFSEYVPQKVSVTPKQSTASNFIFLHHPHFHMHLRGN